MSNPQNPFVINDQYFSQITQQTFEDTKFYILHRSSNLMAAFLGLIGNSLVLYLILYKTPKYFRKFSRILLFSVACDFYFLFSNFWCQARIRIFNGVMIASMTGLVSKFDYNIQCHSVALMASSELLSYLVLPLQYAYRFYTIKNNNTPSWSRTLTYIFISFIFVLLCAFISDRAFCSFKNPDKIDFASYWYKERNIPKLIVGPQFFTPMVIHMCYYSIVSGLCYLIVTCLSRKTMLELQKQTNYLTAKTRALQRQFTIVLLMQSLTPLIVALIPVGASILALFMNSDNEYIGEYIVMSLTWLPFLNSLNILLMIAPYRDCCLHIFGSIFCCGKKMCPTRSSKFSTSSFINTQSVAVVGYEIRS